MRVVGDCVSGNPFIHDQRIEARLFLRAPRAPATNAGDGEVLLALMGPHQQGCGSSVWTSPSALFLQGGVGGVRGPLRGLLEVRFDECKGHATRWRPLLGSSRLAWNIWLKCVQDGPLKVTEAIFN